MPLTRFQAVHDAWEGLAASALVDMKLGRQAANHEGVVLVVGDLVYFPLNGFMMEGMIVSLGYNQKRAMVRLQNCAWDSAKYDVVVAVYYLEPRKSKSKVGR